MQGMYLPLHILKERLYVVFCILTWRSVPSGMFVCTLNMNGMYLLFRFLHNIRELQSFGLAEAVLRPRNHVQVPTLNSEAWVKLAVPIGRASYRQRGFVM